MDTTAHQYHVTTSWDGTASGGTHSYAGYSRDHLIAVDGKPSVHASADPQFRGDAAWLNPEDLFLSAVSSCHLLTYLALCARNKVCVLRYEDAAEGALALHADGGGAFSGITLRPTVTVSADSDLELARALHDRAAALCFIANSCSVPIAHIATVRR